MCNQKNIFFSPCIEPRLTLGSRRRKTCSVHRAIIFVSFLFVLCRQWRRLLEDSSLSSREAVKRVSTTSMIEMWR